MKRLPATLCLLFFLSAANAQEPLYNVQFFVNSRTAGDYYFTSVSDSGNSWVFSSGKKLPVTGDYFHTPGNSIKLEYTDGKQGNWSARIMRQELRGQDHFSEAKFLSFWLFVPGGQNIGMFPSVQFIYSDSSRSQAVLYAAADKGKWVRVLLPLNLFTTKDSIPDRAKIIGLEFSQATRDDGRKTFYIDDAELVPAAVFLTGSTSSPTAARAGNGEVVNQRAGTGMGKTGSGTAFTKVIISSAKGYAKHVDLTWQPVNDPAIKYVKVYRSTDGKVFRAVGIQHPRTGRYADFTGITGQKFYYQAALVDQQYNESVLSAPVSATTRALTDEELLDMVQEASFRYYWEAAEKTSGLAKENIAGREDMIATGASGFGIMALIAGTERKFITRRQAVDRFTKITGFLEKAEKFHGVFGHFYNGPTGKVEPFFGNRDNGGDLVEHSFLMQGLLVARAYFNGTDPAEKKIRERITALWENTEWEWYRRPSDPKFLVWHWSPDQGYVIDHPLIGWNETMVTYLLAIASPTHAVPASMYYTGWANQDSTGRNYRSGWGGTDEGSKYTNGNSYNGIRLEVGVSSGGPLFFTHYSFMGYDPHGLTDKYTNYFTNNQHIAQISHRYSVMNPSHYKGYGDSAWGLTASDGPDGYSADEPVLRQDKGKIAPTGAISSFPYTPAQSMKALKNYYYNYGSVLWGEYGFRDAFNPSQNWVSDIYMGLNQAPMTVMIENYRSGLIWKLFMSDPNIREGLKRLALAGQ